MVILVSVSVEAVAIPTLYMNVNNLSEALSDSGVCAVSYWGFKTDTVIYAKGLTEYDVVTVEEGGKLDKISFDLILKHCYNGIETS